MKNKKSKYDLIRIFRVFGAAGIVVILFFSIKYKSNLIVNKVNINIESQTKQKLIDEHDILKYLNKSLGKDLEIVKINDVDIKKIEKLLNKSHFIENSNVYLDSKNRLNIKCVLKKPIVRVHRENSKDFYIDINGDPVPFSKRATVRVPIITGNTARIQINKKEDSEYMKLWKLARSINDDAFLSALIEQIDIQQNGEILLVPKLGKQKIEFGDLVNSENKLKKVKAFYQSEMKKTGWNKFKKLSVKWDGQIVGSF